VAGIETAATITVFNDGPAVAAGTVLTVNSDNASLAAAGCTATDDSATLVCELGQLPADSWNDIVVGVTPLALEPVTVIASAASAAVDPNTENNASGFIVSVFESTDLAITAGPIQSSTGSDILNAGETVTIPFAVVNNGPTPDADGARATIDLVGLSPTILPPGCLADSTDPDRIACALTTLSSQPVGFTIEAIVESGTDVATVDATISGPGIDPDPTNNRATLEAEVVASADLSIELAPVGNLTRNGPGFVAVEVANAGSSSASAVTISLSAEGADAVPTRHDDPGCSFADGIATCTIDQFAAGSSTTYYVRLDVGDVDTVTITATVTAETADPDLSNNVAVTGPDNPPYFTVGNAPGVVFVDELAGDSTIIGNTSLSCGDDVNTATTPTATTCDSVRNNREPVTPASRNNNWQMEFVDLDGVDLQNPQDDNSSAADLVIPDGSTVEFAALYWSASTGANERSDEVLFSVQPFGGIPATLDDYTALTADTTLSDSGAYQSYREVTDLVTGGGTVWVAGIEGVQASNQYAGWSLVVVWSGGDVERNVVVFDAFERVGQNQTVELDVGGFEVPADGVLTLGMASYEGDLGLRGDSLAITTFDSQGTPSGGGAYSNGANPANDFFNSSISADGVFLTGPGLTAHQPSYANTLGFDLDTISIDAPDARSATFTFSTAGDVYWVGPIVISGVR
jgi:hypothetical protein